MLLVYARVLFEVYARGVPGGRTGSVTVVWRLPPWLVVAVAAAGGAAIAARG